MSRPNKSNPLNPKPRIWKTNKQERPKQGKYQFPKRIGGNVKWKKETEAAMWKAEKCRGNCKTEKSKKNCTTSRTKSELFYGNDNRYHI